MGDDEHDLEVELVVWRDGTPLLLTEHPTVRVRTDDERALAAVVAHVEAQTGLDAAVLELTVTHLHLELLDSPPASLAVTRAGTKVQVQGEAPWNRPGWFVGARAAITSALTDAGAAVIGPFRQVKHWSISALIEVQTDLGTCWYKQVPSFMAHEGALMVWLATIRPGAAPRVIAHAQDWSITAAFGPPSETRSLESPYGLLAELQLAVTDRTADLLSLGCPDRSLRGLVAELQQLAERPAMLEPALAQRLTDALPRAAERVETLLGLPIKSSLVHGDLHGGNWTRQSNGDWLLFDWTDGCVSHPFFDLGVLPTKDDELREARLAAYLEPWRRAFDDEVVAAALEAALPLAAGFHALSYERIIDGVGAWDADSWRPTLHSYVTRLVDALP